MIISCYVYPKQLNWQYHWTGIENQLLTSNRIINIPHIYDFICVKQSLLEIFGIWKITNDS